jgi:hypothetical protein
MEDLRKSWLWVAQRFTATIQSLNPGGFNR